MKRPYLWLFFFFIANDVHAQRVGIGTLNPHPSARLEITDTTRGLLIPRMTAAQRSSMATPAEGLLVYQTNETSGIYQFTGGNWARILYENSGWTLNGNSGTVDSVHHIGTTDFTPLNFRTNNRPGGRIDPVDGNTYFGYLSGESDSSTGFSNSAFGSGSLQRNTTGFNNTAMGRWTLEYNSSGQRNTALGLASLRFNRNGSYNTGIGRLALNRNENGDYNIAIGNNAGGYCLSCNNSIFIGGYGGQDTVSNKLVISSPSPFQSNMPLIEGDFARNTLRINGEIDSPVVYNYITFNDADANSHIATYENNRGAAIYARYFYGHYGDLVIQGQSRVYTGNIHFVTGSSLPGAQLPTQRMVIMDNGKVGIGNFVQGAPRARLEVKEGDVYLSNPANGIVLTAPNGSCWRVTVGNDGTLVRTAISCPNY